MNLPVSTQQQQPMPVLLTLAYELLDAHGDTARLAAGLNADPKWSAHLDYLRALQRRGREIVAASATELDPLGRER